MGGWGGGGGAFYDSDIYDIFFFCLNIRFVRRNNNKKENVNNMENAENTISELLDFHNFLGGGCHRTPHPPHTNSRPRFNRGSAVPDISLFTSAVGVADVGLYC